MSDRIAVEQWAIRMECHFETPKTNRSRARNGVPPETMKMQPQIPPLRPPRRTPVGMTAFGGTLQGSDEFSGQSDMERCSTRNHENAAADPSVASAKGDRNADMRV